MAKPKITDADLCRSAKRVGTSTAEIETFLEVETKGRGFDSQGRPLILFERHWFHKLTRGKFSASHPHISNPTPGGYGTSASQYARFSEAFGLAPEAAMKSASWGLGQVMGFNHAIVGYPTVNEFVDAMKESEGKQLDAAIEFVMHNGLDDELRRHDWAGFARGYNGKGYKKNDYDTKLKTAYTKHSKNKIDCQEVAEIQQGNAPAPESIGQQGGLSDGERVFVPSVFGNPNFAGSSIFIPSSTLTTDAPATDGAEGTSGKEEPPAPPAVEVKAATMSWSSILTSIGAFLTAAGISLKDGLSNPYTLIVIGIFAVIGYLIWDRSQKQKQQRTMAYFANAQNPNTPAITVV